MILHGHFLWLLASSYSLTLGICAYYKVKSLGHVFQLLQCNVVFPFPFHEKFSSWHEVLRVTTRFSQLSGRVHNSRMACIASSRGNLVAASWFTYPMNVLTCSTMVSPSVYFSLTIFLIKDVLLREFFLSYRPHNFCHIS